MAATIEVTESELLEALRRAMDTPAGGGGDGMLASELAEALGWSRKRVYAALQRLRRAGVIEPALLWREKLDGVQQRLRGYRMAQR